MNEIYISTDVETDGLIPGEYSMLSIGSVAFSSKGKTLGKFYRKLKKLKSAKQHPEVMKFWKENQKEYKVKFLKFAIPTEQAPGYYANFRDRISHYPFLDALNCRVLNPKRNKEATKNAEAPSKVMKDYIDWLEK